jgi:hypothetical protein
MEFTKTESQIIEEAVNETHDASVRDLNDLQLAFVGGGIGDCIGA